VETRIRIGWNKFRQLVPLLTNKDISLTVRGRLYSSCVRSRMLHGSETWPVRKENEVSQFLSIQQVSQATLLVIDMTSALSASAYVNRMLMQINQCLYLLSQLKSQGMKVQALCTLFSGLIMSKITYALLAFAGQLTADDRNRICAVS